MHDLALFAKTSVDISVAALLAALGELVCERAGTINLGIEGMMLAGALAAAAAAPVSLGAGVLAAVAAGIALSALHALFTVRLRADQILTGLCVTMIGVGLSHFLGAPLIGKPVPGLPEIPLPGLAALPVLGPAFFSQNVLAYAAWGLAPAIWYALWRTRPGLWIRFCGENPQALAAAGIDPQAVRACSILFGGAMAGAAGAALSLALTPGFKENMTGGQGFIALGLVIFSGWRPGRLAACALAFGALSALPRHLAALGLDAGLVSPLRMLPYLATVAALAASRLGGHPQSRGGRAPAALGLPYFRQS